jgi:hypothetical protein
MRIVAWSWYVPDVEDNRARRDRGEPHLRVELCTPSAEVWWTVERKIVEDEAQRQRLATVGTNLAVRIALFDPAIAELLWRPCVRGVEIPPGFIDGLAQPITTGEALWAARTRLDSAALYRNILDALVNSTELEAGLAGPLVSPSAPLPALALDPARDGTAASVASRA